MTRHTLNQSAPVTLDASGNGTAKLGPISHREHWFPEAVAVRSGQAPGTIVNEAQCKIYCGPDTTDVNLVDVTLSGSTGDSTGRVSGRVIHLGEFVFAAWNGGDAGAQVRMTVAGQREISGWTGIRS